MKLLMITRKVDKQDHLAGFIFHWVRKIGGEVDKLYVVCLESGDLTGLPDNIKVFGLNTKNKFWKFIKFQYLALRLVPKVQGIFCHQNPEYTIAIAPTAKLFRKKIVSWYTHGTVSFKMKLMEKLANVVLSASKASFRLSSKKLFVLGHGIDVGYFQGREEGRKGGREGFRLLTVGRISPTKDIESMIKAVGILKKQGISDVKLKIVGAPGLKSHEEYLKTLHAVVHAMTLEENVEFVGAVPNQEIVPFYQDADVCINMSGTGSMDKTVLEAMACECLILTSNDAFEEVFDEEFLVEKNSPNDLAHKILALKNLPEQEREKIGKGFRDYVATNHNLDNLVKKIVKQF